MFSRLRRTAGPRIARYRRSKPVQLASRFASFIENAYHNEDPFTGHPDLTCDRPRHEGLDAVPFEAQVMRGDEYVERHHIGRIGFVKIDVEGAEYRVLQGFARTLAAGTIDCIQFEYGAFSIQTRVLLADYFAMLGSRYAIGKIYPSYVDFADYSWRMEGFRFANFLAVSRSRVDLRHLVEG